MNTTLIDKKLQDEYERTIIVMLIGGSNDKNKKHIIAHLEAGMFTNKLYRDFYNVIVNIDNSNEDLNLSSVCENISLEKQKQLVLELDNEYITNYTCDFYLSKLLNSYISRLVEAAKTLDEFRKIEDIKTKYALKANVQQISHNSEKLIEDYFNNIDTCVKTYYKDIDDKLGSLQGGDFMILAGATGMGKTGMMLNMILKIAKNGKKVLMFSLEMSLKQLQNRLISAITGLNAMKVRNFSFTPEEIERYTAFITSNDFKSLNIDVSTEYNVNIEQIRNTVLQSDADIVFIDYLGLIQGDVRKNSYERLGDISRQLKILALDSNKPFVILHQLNRAASDRTDKRPMISDLRDSGKIEQDADFICFVYRPAYYNFSADKKDLQFLISKSRHGPGKATINLVYQAENQLILDKKDIEKKEVQTKLWDTGF